MPQVLVAVMTLSLLFMSCSVLISTHRLVLDLDEHRAAGLSRQVHEPETVIQRIAKEGASSTVDAACTAFLWPLPRSVVHGNRTRRLNVAKMKLVLRVNGVVMPSNPTIDDAWERYRELITGLHPASTSVHEEDGIPSLVVDVQDTSEAHPQLETVESYTLAIGEEPSDDIHVKAVNLYGAIRGMETLSQSIRFNYEQEMWEIRCSPWTIDDAPRFRHRGLLIDSSRHFLPLRRITRILDSMAFVKLNVLHWHMSDDESFPLQVHSHPSLWNGSYSMQERYLQRDVQFVVEYARKRGIRVMLELDGPGHASSWCVGEPSVCPMVPSCLTPLNVANSYTFEVIQDILSEMTDEGKWRSGIFPYDLVHLGGDEVDTKCWTASDAIAKWMENHHMSANDAYKYFVDRVSNITVQLRRRPVVWVEVFEQFGPKLHPSTIVHVWKGKDSLKEVVAAGSEALLSNQRDWYLDHLKTTWQQMYENEPFEQIDDEIYQQRILGGEAAMWGETVDGSDLESTVWPRLAAFAERMWSSRNVKDIKNAQRRLHYLRCRLLERGIAVAPVNQKGAREAPPHFGSCMEQ